MKNCSKFDELVKELENDPIKSVEFQKAKDWVHQTFVPVQGFERKTELLIGITCMGCGREIRYSGTCPHCGFQN